MSTEQLQPGQNPAGLAEGGVPRLGATHAENAGFGEARDLGPGEVAEMFGPAPTPRQRLEAQGIEFVESGAEMGGGGGDSIEDWVQQQGGYQKIFDAIQKNKWTDGMTWTLNKGTSQEVNFSVAEIKVRRLLGDKNSPVDSLISLRQEIQGGKASWIKGFEDKGISSEELMIGLDVIVRQRIEQGFKMKQGTSPITYAHNRMNELVAENLSDLSRQKEFSEIDLYLKIVEAESPDLRRWRVQLKKEISQLSPDQAKIYFDRKKKAFEDADMLGELPVSADGRSTLIPPGVDFKAALNSLVQIGIEGGFSVDGIRRSPVEVSEEPDKSKERIVARGAGIELPQVGITRDGLRAIMAVQPGYENMMPPGMSRDIAMYMFEPEYDRVVRFAANLSEEQRNQWVARLTGALIRAGGAASRARFYLSALGGDEGAASIESAIAKGQALVERIMSLTGYLKPDQLHQAAQFFKPEEIAALNETPIKSTIGFTLPDWIRDWAQSPDHSGEFIPRWIKDYKFGSQGLIQRSIEICPKDVLAVFYKTEAMKELLQSQAAGDTGYWEARGKWFEYALWLRAGIPESLAREIISRPKNERPEIKMTNQLTMTTRRNVASKEIWLGENWWMVMEAEATLLMSRSDYGMMPIDEFARRWFLGLRGTEQADYTRLYDLSDPFLQTLGGITYLPEYFSLVAKNTMVDPLQEEARKVFSHGEEKLNLLDKEGEGKIFKLRCDSVERLILINQPSPAKAKELAEMVMGLGEYRPEGNGIDVKIENWKRKVVDGMKVIDKTGIKRLRLPELWRFVTAEHLGMTQAELESAWAGFDFSGWLGKEGLSKEEIDSAPTIGIRGWDRFKAAASLRLMKMMGDEQGESPYRDYDKNFRYLIKATENLDALGPLFVMTWESSTLKPIHIGVVHPANKKEIQQEVPSSFGAFQTAIAEVAQKIRLGNFITKEAGQSMNLAAIQGFRDTHCAWSRDKSFIEMVEVKQAGRGTTFSLQRLTEKRLVEQWAQSLGVSSGEEEQVLKDEILPFLNGYQFYFVETMEMKHAMKREKDMPLEDRKTSPILLGPHTGAVPEVTTPRQLYKELQDITRESIEKRERAIGQRLAEKDPEYQGWKRFVKDLDGYSQEEGFCWARLRDAAWSLPPDILVDLAEALDKSSTLSGGIMEALVVETKGLIDSGKLLPHAILDGGWRFRIDRTLWLTKATEGIYTSPIFYKVWKKG